MLRRGVLSQLVTVAYRECDKGTKMKSQLLSSKTGLRAKPFTAAAPSAGCRNRAVRNTVVAQAASQDPLLVRAARGEDVERAPCWMMRQAGR